MQLRNAPCVAVKVDPRRKGVPLAGSLVALLALGDLRATAADLGAAAAPVAPAPPPPVFYSGWQFTIAPYGWFTSVKGSSTVRGLKTNVDESFVDIVQKGDSVLGLMGHVEARYDNWSVLRRIRA
jgi:hypothetical protein